MMESWERKMEHNNTVIEKYLTLYFANPSLLRETLRVALNVMSGAGYGFPLEWESCTEINVGHQMSFHESILFTLDNLVILFSVPRFFSGLPIKHLQKTNLASTELGRYLQELVDLARSRHEKSSQNDSILNALVARSAEVQEHSKERVLRDDEIVGNAFIFLLAGHETTYIPC